MTDDIWRNTFAGVTPAWHRKGEALAAGTTAEEAMKIAKLNDWDVVAVRVSDLLPDVTDNGMMVLLRRDPDTGETLLASDQLVTERYRTASNEEVYLRMVPALAGFDMPVDCAGVLGRLGNRAFMTFDAGAITLPGNEEYLRWLVAIADHSGRGATNLFPSSFRVVCANTEAAAMRIAGEANCLEVIPHTQGAHERFWEDVDRVRAAIGMVNVYTSHLDLAMRELQADSVTDANYAEFHEYVSTAMGKKDTERKQVLKDESLKRLDRAWMLEVERAEKLGQDVSVWTLAQTVSTYTQHTSYGGERQHTARALNIAENRLPAQMRMMNGVLAEYIGTRSAKRYLVGAL